MRYTQKHPLILGDVDPSTPPRHVVATGVGIGMGGFDLNEELWAQGDLVAVYARSGLFIYLDDPQAPALTDEQVAARSLVDVDELGGQDYVDVLEGTTVTVIGQDGSRRVVVGEVLTMEGEPGPAVQLPGSVDAVTGEPLEPVRTGVGMTPPPAARRKPGRPPKTTTEGGTI